MEQQDWGSWIAIGIFLAAVAANVMWKVCRAGKDEAERADDWVIDFTDPRLNRMGGTAREAEPIDVLVAQPLVIDRAAAPMRPPPIPPHPRRAETGVPIPLLRDKAEDHWIKRFGDMAEFGAAIEFGRSIPYVRADGQTLNARVEVDPYETADFLMADAIRHLPPGTRFELRRKVAGNLNGMAWFRCGYYQDKVEPWNVGPVDDDPDIISRHITPAASETLSLAGLTDVAMPEPISEKFRRLYDERQREARKLQ